MAASITDGFAAMGELSSDRAWAPWLQKRVADALAANGPDAAGRLASIYFEAERELVRRSNGELQENAVREKLRPAFATTSAEYPAFSLIFLSPEKQFLELHAAFLRLYADELRPFVGPRGTERFLETAFEGTPFKDVKVSLAKGFEASAMRFRTVKECSEAAYALFERWYVSANTALGWQANRRAFERAFLSLARTHGFLPAHKHLLGATPIVILSREKATRLHELEMETAVQAQDIRATDASLRLQSERLRQTVEELEETKQMLEKTGKARLEFIDVVSHQFRTPLSAMRWNGEFLIDEFRDKGIDPAVMEAMQNVRIKSVFLIETLDRVFTTLDIETGKLTLDLKPAFFWEVVQDAYASLERDIAFYGMKWKFNKKKEQLQQIPLDKVRMHSVMKILIGNAISYGKEKGTIMVDLEQKQLNGLEYLVVSVKDEGLGIEEPDRERIFEKFYRAQPAIHKVADGTGLGLFIIRNVAEAHHGLAWAESPGLGQGATFFVALPIVQPEPKKQSAAFPTPSVGPQVKRQTII